MVDTWRGELQKIEPRDTILLSYSPNSVLNFIFRYSLSCRGWPQNFDPLTVASQLARGIGQGHHTRPHCRKLKNYQPMIIIYNLFFILSVHLGEVKLSITSIHNLIDCSTGISKFCHVQSHKFRCKSSPSFQLPIKTYRLNALASALSLNPPKTQGVGGVA